MKIDPPLEPAHPGSVPHWCEIIDLAGVAVQRGRRAAGFGRCEHASLVYCTDERRVWCEDCERTIEGFDAFMTLTKHFHKILHEATWKRDEAQRALDATIQRRAAKAIDKAWSGHQMAISCPHCRQGLLPEDFVCGDSSHLSVSQTSREIELARRGRAAKEPT